MKGVGVCKDERGVCKNEREGMFQDECGKGGCKDERGGM